jgi:valyl-tRNA synthetase
MTSEPSIDKNFNPAAIEAKWYHHWESTGAFRPERPGATPYTIVNPPPNVTGSLHIGHALDNTLQDILIRHARLQGKDALWVVGMDHAGIATQMVVERKMNAKGQKRTDFTREEFIAKVWEWKHESGGEITGQLRRLGCSMDWKNERFTMDEGFSKGVIKVFVDLYNQGLLYRDKRLVNWDPHFKTAISDLEVETREVNGHMWHFKYPLAGGETYTYVERDADGHVTLSEERDYISIATTRPETMLGDGAVAVHLDDERYKPIVGKLCEIPVGPKEHRRLIPIITDEYPDPDFGSGAVKITGAHDQNDYGVAQRNNIPMYRLMDDVAAMRSDGGDYATTAAQAKAIAAGGTFTAADIDALNLVPDAYRGLDRYEARKRVVADIDADGLMVKVEDKAIQQPFGDRSGVVIEPMLTDQWYVDAATLAKPAIEAARKGAAGGGFDIVPKSWEKTYFNWMENIQPWCVSRQLWWGHRIPAWFDPDGNIFVAENEASAQALAGAGVALVQDNDVLDTWFSSALWPFGTLGWPETESSPSTCDGEGDRAEGVVEGTATLIAPPSVAAFATPATSPSQVDGEDKKSLLNRHYPNDVLISGFDILFFWDARMAMQGLHFMKEVPWKTLYLHGLVRAADGSKMSKSKGNTVDPLGLIDQYGADALRFFMAAMESQGRDIKMDESRVAGYRNFATKLWNAARFAQSNGISGSHSVAAPKAKLAVNKWIIGEVVETVEKLNKAFAEFRFDGMADTIYHFVWDQFCDWYLELIKPVLNPPRNGKVAAGTADGGVPAFGVGANLEVGPLHHPADGPPPRSGEELAATETREVAGWVLDQILVMLHPFMPFITEELWHALGERKYDLIHAKWPEPKAEIDIDCSAEIARLIEVVSDFRACRIAARIEPKVRVQVSALEANPFDKTLLKTYRSSLSKMINLTFGRLKIEHDEETGTWPTSFEFTDEVEDFVGRADQNLTAVRLRSKSLEMIGSVEMGFIDVEGEKARITKAIEAASKERDILAGRLSNAAFVERAKPEAVEKARADHAEKSAEAERLTAALARLG